MSKSMKCPKCKSTNIEVLGSTKKGFSVGKAIVGGTISFGVGALARLTGKKGKYKIFCKECGNRWKTK